MAENSRAKQRHQSAVDNTPGSAPSVPWISLSQWPEPAVSPDLSHLQMLQARQRKQQAACRRAATERASLEAVPAIPSSQEMVLFVLAQDSQNCFTGSQLPFLRNSHNPVCNEDTSPQIALADVDGHTPRVVWGFICTIDATRKPDVSGGYTILFHHSFPLVLRMVLSVLGKHRAARRLLPAVSSS